MDNSTIHMTHLMSLTENANHYSFIVSQAPPKEVPKTIENQRIYDETTVNPEDEEVCLYLQR